MKWVLIVAAAYAFFMLLGVGLMQFLSKADRVAAYSFPSEDGRYVLAAYRDIPLPFGLGGGGRSPGELEVRDARGHVVDSVHVSDVMTVHGVRWELFKVDYFYVRNGREYANSLDLEP